MAAAYRVVIHDLAPGVLTASTWTGILTLVGKAGLGQRAVRADYALWSASWRVANESCLARADRVIVHHFADAVCSAGGWGARLSPWFWKN